MKALVIGAAALAAAFALAQSAAAASGVKLTPAIGHPNLSVAVSGTGFAASEAVDVYVDTVDTSLLVTSSTGTLLGSVTVPASAQPGTHYVTAIGRKSGDAAQSKFTVTTPWPAFGFGVAHRGWNPYENTLSTSNVTQLGQLWRAGLNGAGATPTVSSGRVFVTTSAGLQARSTASGALLWTQLSTQSFYASPVVSGLSVYIASGSSGNFYALNTATGATRWSQTLNSDTFSSAAVANDVAYVASYNGTVYAFKTVSGALLWSFTTGGSIDSSPVVVDGAVYIGCQDDKLYALDATTGAMRWTYATGAAVESTPAVLGGIVYFGSDDDNVYALNADNGAVIWSTATNGQVNAPPAVADGKVFVGTDAGGLYAFDQGTGQQLWASQFGRSVSSPAVANGVVYAVSRNNLIHMLDEYGDVLASLGGGQSYFGGPVVSDGVVYVNTYQGPTYALGLQAQAQARPGGPPLPSSLHPDFNLKPMR